jgi:hypothetical protein
MWKLSCQIHVQYSKPSSNEDPITRVNINANNYLPKAENSIIRGLPNTL